MGLKIDTKKLEKARADMRIPRYRFSLMLGMSQSTYFKILESRSASLKTISRLAKILKIDPKDLLTTV